jgi:Protein of unknown function (DUF4012)
MPSRPRRRLLRWILLGVALLVVVAGVVVADAYLQALRFGRDLRALTPELSHARQQVFAGGTQSLDQIERDAERVSSEVHGARFTFGLVGLVPFVGRPVDAVQHAADAAGEGAQALEIARNLVDQATGESTGAGLLTNGRVNISLLSEMEPRLADLVAHLEAGYLDIQAIPHVPFLGDLDRLKAEALTDAQQALDSGRRALTGVRLLPSLFGADGPRTYFLALQNNADLRGTGGAVLGWGIVRMDGGAIRLLGGGPIGDIDERVGPKIPVPSPIRWYLRVTHRPRRLNNGINYSPNFPSVASTWAHQIEATRGLPINGVIALDPVGVAALLQGQGSIRIPSYDQPLDAGNIVQFTEHDQYALPQSVQSELPGELVKAAFGLLTDPRNVLAMGQSLSTAVADKRIQLWAEDPKAQGLIESLGWDGAITRGPGDYLYLTDNKRDPNKVDYFSDITLDYHVTIDADGTGHSTAAVTLDNNTPPGEDSYVVGRVTPYALNVALLGLYVPKRTTELSVTPDAPTAYHVLPQTLRYHTDTYRRVLVKNVEAWPGHPAALTFAYRTPDLVQDTPEGKLYQLVVQHQPLAHPVHLRVTLTLPDGARITSPGKGWTVSGNQATFSTDLTRDFDTSVLYR